MFKNNNNIKSLLNINLKLFIQSSKIINSSIYNSFSNSVIYYSSSSVSNKKRNQISKFKERSEKSKKQNEQYDFKSSYIKFSTEELLKRKREREGKKSFQELLEENYKEVSHLMVDENTNSNTSTEATQPDIYSPPTIKNKKKDAKPVTDISKPIFTDENSSPEDIKFEESVKKLMIEQGKTNISDVRIPTELIESTYGIQKELTQSEIRFANLFFSKGASLDSMAIKGVDFPKKSYPQVAFIGKSNAGKSSLLNAILNRDLAYVSKKPGCTRSINFYQLWEKIYLVDLPGYGFARVSKKKSSVWGEAISEYLLTTPNLFKIFFLIDSRVNLHSNDKEAIKLIDQHKVSFQIVLTKIDKTKPSVLKGLYRELKEVINDTSCCLPTILQTSSLESRGLDDIRSIILNVTGMDKESFMNRKKEGSLVPNQPNIQLNNNNNNNNKNNNNNNSNKNNNNNNNTNNHKNKSFKNNNKNKNNNNNNKN